MFIKNKYSKYYYSIVKRAKSRTLSPDTYAETHHIIPECFFINRSRKGKPGWLEGNPESPNNKVKLTAKEHITCHRLLVRMTAGDAKSKMAFAAWRMVFACKRHKRDRVSSRTYESAKLDMIAARKASKGLYKHSTKSKKKISKGNTGLRKGKTLVELYGAEKAAEWQFNSSKSRTGKKRGPQTEEWRSNVSKGLTGKSRVEFTAEHRANMSRGRIGKLWFHNGIVARQFKLGEEEPGFIRGRLKKV